MKKKIYVIPIGKGGLIVGIIGISLLLLIDIAFFIIGVFIDVFMIVGFVLLGCFMLAFTMIAIGFARTNLYMYIDGDDLTYKNLYGKIMLRHSLSELKSIEIKSILIEYHSDFPSIWDELEKICERYREYSRLSRLQNYIILNFSDSPIEETTIEQLQKNKDRMLLRYNAENKEMLQQLTDLPITDNREIEETFYDRLYR